MNPITNFFYPLVMMSKWLEHQFLLNFLKFSCNSGKKCHRFPKCITQKVDNEKKNNINEIINKMSVVHFLPLSPPSPLLPSFLFYLFSCQFHSAFFLSIFLESFFPPHTSLCHIFFSFGFKMYVTRFLSAWCNHIDSPSSNTKG